MRRAIAIVLVGVCAFVPARPRAQSATARTPFSGLVTFDQLFASYQPGHYDVVANTLRSLDDLKWFNTTLKQALSGIDRSTGKPFRWDRRRAAFLLEVAAVASTHPKADVDVLAVISAGRLMVTGRPALPGADGKEDAFEGLWHRIAVAVMQRKVNPVGQAVYLDTVDGRVQRSGQPRDPWLVLDHAVANEQLAWTAEYQNRQRSTRLTPLPKTSETTKVATLLRAAVKSADAASALPEVTVEANVRRAEILLKLGRMDEALAGLRATSLRDADLVQQYWAALLEARALHELHRLPEAEHMYRAAQTLWPDASSPGTGLALVLFDMNRREDALAAAAAVRALPPDGADPWWSYQLATARFINRWLGDLHELIP